MDSILPYLLIDVLVVAIVAINLLPRLTFWHPFAVYLFFHLYSFTWRAYGIYSGDPLMYAGQLFADPINIEEIQRALLMADLSLIMFMLGAWVAHKKHDLAAEVVTQRRALNPAWAMIIGFICLPAGFFALFFVKTIGVGPNVDDATTGYIQAAAMWPIGAAGLLIFVLGFRWYLVLPATLYLSFVVFQGYHRFMFVLPVLYFVAVFSQKKGRRWPPVYLVAPIIFLGAVFPYMKQIGAAVQRGEYANAISLVEDSFFEKKEQFGDEASNDLLDQFAGSLTLIDWNERKFMGSTYLSVLTLPVPRALWPSKPGLGDHLREISTAGRNYAKQGRIITYIGESYLNFGYAGIITIPLILGYILTRFCLYADSGPTLGLARYAYLILFMTFLQAYRDGLTSLVLFSAVHNMPGVFILIIHMIPGVAQTEWHRPRVAE